MSDPLSDVSTAIDEPGWGGGMHITDPAERRKYKERSRKRKNKWARAQAIRANWTEEQFAEEEARLRAEIDAWVEGHRDAA